MDHSDMRSPLVKVDSVVQTWLLKPSKQRRFRLIVSVAASLFVFSALWTYYSLMWAYDDNASLSSDNEFPTIVTDPGKSLIPEKVWQIIFKDDDDCDPEDLRETKTWLAKNINHQYTLLGKQKSDKFVYEHYADEPKVIATYEALWNTGMKSDLLRYLVLNVEGGVYADIDTRAIKPIDKWVPSYLRNRIRLVAGLEFDRLDGGAWVGMQHYAQFGQWTFAGAPGHPVFRKLIDRVVEGVENLATAHGVTIQELRPNKHTDVVNTTGPIAFTDMILEEITKVDPNITDMQQLSPFNENVVIGDMLLLPIDAFGMGQQHSASTNDGSTPKNALVQHLFWGHWTKGDQMGDDKKDDDKKDDDKKDDDKKDDDKKDDGKKDDDKKGEDKEKEKEEDKNQDTQDDDKGAE